MSSTSLGAVDLVTTEAGPSKRFPLAALLVFALLGFLLISTETMPAGVLPQIAGGLATSSAVAGQLVSVYALGTVLATVPAIVLTRRFRRKPLLVVVLACFLVANAATALSPHVAVALASRFVAGALSGTLWGMLAGYTLRITAPDRAGRALSIMSLGAPVGMAFGTPLGTWLGVTFGWRWSFGGLGVLSAAGLVAALLLVPDAAGQQATVRSRPARVLRIPGVAAVLLVIVAWMLGNSTAYTYIAPFLEASRSSVRIDVLLVVFGLASIGGLALTALLVDRRPRALVVSSLVGFAAAGVLLVAEHQSPVAVYAAIVLWGLGFGGASPQLQRALSKISGEHADVANSFLPVAFNVAIFLAGVLGAVVLGSAGALALPLTITFFGLVGLLVVLLFRRSVYPRDH